MVYRNYAKEWKLWSDWLIVLKEEDDKRAAAMRAAAEKLKAAQKNNPDPPEWFRDLKKDDQKTIKEMVKKPGSDEKEVRSDLQAKMGEAMTTERAKEIYAFFNPSKKHDLDDKSEMPAKRRRKNPQKFKKWKNIKNLRTVYVEGMPTNDNWTLSKFVDFFQKVGIVAKDTASGKPKAKLYRDKKTGKLKGAGVITFFHEMTANMAIKLKNGATLSGNKLKVSLARFEKKGDYRPPPKKSKGERRVDHEKFLAGKQQRLPFLKICILKNMFSPLEVAGDPEGPEHFYEALEKEIDGEIRKFGVPKKITVFEGSPVGAVAT